MGNNSYVRLMNTDNKSTRCNFKIFRYHAGLDKIIPGIGAGFEYHVISFSALKITCVSTKKQDICPEKAAATALNLDIKDDTKSIEGFFIKDDFRSGKCDVPSLGVYNIYLSMIQEANLEP